MTGVDLTQPFAITAVIALAGFTALLIKDTIADLRKQRDASQVLLAGLSKAVEDLADVVKDGFRGPRQ